MALSSACGADGPTLVHGDGAPVLIGEVKAVIRVELARRALDDHGETIFAAGREAGFPHSRGDESLPVPVGKPILFDIFPHAREVTVVEVAREREYAPVKNAEGGESPATARQALEEQYRRWFREAGREPPEGVLELSPLDALGPDDLRHGGPRRV